MLVKTNVNITIKINRGVRHFVQMLRRGESGTSALIGQTYQIFLCLCCVWFSHNTSERKHKRKHKEKENVDPSSACGYACGLCLCR